MMRKDIFGNEYEEDMQMPNSYARKMPTRISYAQKLREAKDKQRYKLFQAEQKKQKVEQFKKHAQRSKLGLQKMGGLIKKGHKRATDKRLTSVREKMRGSIYKK